MREMQFLIGDALLGHPSTSNTMVKTKAADDTILVTVWKSRWLPDLYGLIAQPVRAHA